MSNPSEVFSGPVNMTPEIVIILLVLSFFGEIKENFILFFVEMKWLIKLFGLPAFHLKSKQVYFDI